MASIIGVSKVNEFDKSFFGGHFDSAILDLNNENTAWQTPDLNSAHSNYVKSTVCQLLTQNATYSLNMHNY